MSAGPEVQSVGSAQARLLSPSYPQAAFSPGSLLLPYKESLSLSSVYALALWKLPEYNLPFTFHKSLTDHK